eukprot:GDKJ01043451.1.p1 GENE.GDKJ01043451.1~~GDKJ01043451.1.p1  ORF type:complete len:445 (-),score=97.41 GDKJ01043451.1:238-1572(-)
MKSFRSSFNVTRMFNTKQMEVVDSVSKPITSAKYGVVATTSFVKQTRNPIRELVDRMHVKPNPEKKLIPLSIGDPTIYGNFNVPEFTKQILDENYKTSKFNGYAHSSGYEHVRGAIAEKFSPPKSEHRVHASDIVITSGASQALDFAINALLEPGRDTLLVPRPGFPLYHTLCTARGIAYAHYDLNSTASWNVDLEGLKKLIAANPSAKAILLNNPANPTGACYTEKHLRDILKICEDNGLVVISDEIYQGMVFDETKTPATPLSYLSDNVPIVECGGLAKRWMVPGWRVGWTIVHDRHGALQLVKDGLSKLATLTLGPSTLMQSLVPALLEKTDAEYFKDTNERLEQHSLAILEGLKGIDGLTPIMPQGTMYLMVQIDLQKLGLEDDMEFAKKLLEEESVFVLPGQCFDVKGFFRIVTTSPIHMLNTATDRIRAFCERRTKKN